MEFLYRLGIQFYNVGIRIASLFSLKAKQWINGRKDIFARMEREVEKNAIWIHAASLGEFEQGRPLIEALKREYPDQKILLTFFSPSGYEIRKGYAFADYIYYLPIDTPKNAKRFVHIIQPKMAIFIKYEFWHYYIKTLSDQNIPIYSISALFRDRQIYFKWYGRFYKKILLRFDQIFVQNAASLNILAVNKISNASIAGDTRVDRVWDIQQKTRMFPIIETFANRPILVAGSTWQPDEAILVKFCKEFRKLPFKIIIAPHDINDAHIERLQRSLPREVNAVRYSRAKNLNVSAAKVLIIDNVGMLSALYRYGKWAYIGGGFGKGLHNTLEPIAFGLPVVFGEKYQKFEEARWLVEHQGGFTIKNYNDFERAMTKLYNKDFYKKASSKAFEYIETNRGATTIILEYLATKDLSLQNP